MAKFQEFKSFGELQEQREQDLQNEIKEALEGKLGTFPSGNFKTQIEGLESVSITRPDAKPGQEATNLNIMPFWQNGGRHSTLSLNSEGKLTGEIPPVLEKLGVTKEQISRDILHTIKTIDLDFYTPIDDEILPPGEREIEGERREKSGGEKSPAIIDPKRLRFWEDQPDALFAFHNRRNGFKGYRGVVYTWGLVLDNPETEHAFYGVREPIMIDPNILKLPAAKRMTLEQRHEILEKVWNPIKKLSRAELHKAGAVRKVHPKTSDPNWEEKMIQKLAEIRA